MKRLVHLCCLAVLLGWGCGDDDGGNANQNNNTTLPVCGNGMVETGEQCDEGAGNDDTAPGACRTDCRTAHCGDGVIDVGEACDTAALGGASCAGEGYTAGTLSCSATCELDPAGCTTCGDGVQEGDEECDGLDTASQGCLTLGLGQHGVLRCDDDCHFDGSGCHTCGDGVVEPAEACEPGLLASCADAGYSGGSRQCSSTCDIIGACESVCGNGIVEPDEGCDGLELGGATCATLGYFGGELSCSASCQLNTGGCSSCGDGVVDAGEECDGAEVGGATCASALGPGYMGAAGCTAGCLLDLSGCEAPVGCGNGVVEPGLGEQCDGMLLGGYTCALLRPGVYGGGVLTCRGNCTLEESGCTAVNPCGNGVREAALGEACDGAELGGATCVSLGLPGGTLACGADCRYDLGECEAPATCGDGEIDLGELCDGANLGSQTCATAGYHGGTLGCTAQCRLNLSGCTNCGNGVKDAGEVCDGAAVGTATCVSQGYYGGTLGCNVTCSALVTTGCSGRCGDGTVNGTEVCDDGVNSGGYNGCLPGCSGLGPRCGDGVINGTEVCDDGVNSGGYNGCMPGCSALGPRCGDGVINGSEVCDDGVNSGGYNGCMPGCSALGPRCGDGVINGSEVCDGLALGGDTCVAHLYTGGNLACQAGCGAVDVSGCTGGTCVDNDGDGYGTGCAAGLDCDDDAPGITGACQGNGCPAGWVYIAAGAFEMGCQSGDPCYLAYANESPRHPVTVSAYCMEATEVSVGAYRACKDGGHCAGGAPTTSASSTFCNWSAVPEGRDPHPINCINWTESQAYCQEWLGGDLPTEAEWEKAARGNEQRIYPWGSAAPDCLHTNFDVNASGSGYGCSSVTVGPGTWEVGHLVSGAGDSAYGLKDMAGNVWEWVRDWYGSTFYSDCAGGCTDPLNTSSASGYRVIRGGGFYSDGADSLRAVYRNSLAPTNRGHDLGFRCRRTP